MAAIKLQVQNRTDIGTNKVKKLRNSDIIPGVVYSRGAESRHIQVDRVEFTKTYREAGMTNLINLDLDGETVPVLIRELQTHPYKDEYYHIDFLMLKMDETIRLTIPVILLGRDNVKIDDAILMQHLDELEVECLPAHIPNTAEVDVSDIDFGTSYYVSDLDVFKDENITVLSEDDELVANLVEAQEEEEDEEIEELGDMDAGEVPVVGEEDEEEDQE